MRLLITNDDGIDSPGLSALAEAAAAWCESGGHELVIAAPASEQSGSSASMGVLAHHKPVACSRETVASQEAYRVDATPGACVILGCLGAFGEPPNIVLSGINYGANCGRSVLPSGTIGAALTAANYGRSGLAVSLDAPGEDPEMFWDVAAQMACDYLDWVCDSPKKTAASLNVPNLSREDIRGVQFAPPLAPYGVVVTEFVSYDGSEIRTRIVRAPGEVPEGSDRDLLLKGWAVLTPITLPSVAAEAIPPSGPPAGVTLPPVSTASASPTSASTSFSE